MTTKDGTLRWRIKLLYFDILNSVVTKTIQIFTNSEATFTGIGTDSEGNIYAVGMSDNTLHQLTCDDILLQESE